MRHGIVATVGFAVIAVLPGRASARIREHVSEELPRPRASAARSPLPTSQFPDRIARGERYDLICPHTVEPNPIVIIAPDAAQTLEESEGFGFQLASAGYIAVVVEPPRDRRRYAAALAAVLDEILVAEPDPREPGCRHTAVSGAFGLGSGGAAVLELAHRRETRGEPLAGVLTAYVHPSGAAVPALVTPTLIVEGARLPERTGHTSLVISGGHICDLIPYTARCERIAHPTLPLERRQRAEDLRRARADAFSTCWQARPGAPRSFCSPRSREPWCGSHRFPRLRLCPVPAG